MSSCSDWIFEVHQLWQSGFSRVYSNSCCSCSFEPEIIKIGESPHKISSNNILNYQVSTTILNACTKKSGILLKAPRINRNFFPFPGKYLCVRCLYPLSLCLCLCHSVSLSHSLSFPLCLFFSPSFSIPSLSSLSWRLISPFFPFIQIYSYYFKICVSFSFPFTHSLSVCRSVSLSLSLSLSVCLSLSRLTPSFNAQLLFFVLFSLALLIKHNFLTFFTIIPNSTGFVYFYIVPSPTLSLPFSISLWSSRLGLHN